MVVHREPEQDHEQEQGQPVGDPAVRLEAEQRLAPAFLEHQGQHPVGRAHGEQVEDDRLDRDHDRAERDQHQHEREPEDEREHERHPLGEQVAEVARLGGATGDPHRRAVDRADGRRDQVVADLVERGHRRLVGAVAAGRDRDTGHRAVVGDVDLGCRRAASSRPPPRRSARRSRRRPRRRGRRRPRRRRRPRNWPRPGTPPCTGRRSASLGGPFGRSSVPVWTTFMPSAGRARATSRPPAATIETTG